MLTIMSVYSTVPNSNIFFKRINNDLMINNHTSLNREVHIALTPPNTPTHGVIISTGPAYPYHDGDEAEAEELLGQPRAYILMNNSNSCSAQSTPSDLRSMCETPDSVEPWNIPQLSSSSGPKWNDLDIRGKVRYMVVIILKIITLIALLYFFICSLDLLSISFRLLGAHIIGNLFTDNVLLQNPVVGLMIGVLVTVLVQSSSTSTSIAVTMVASRIIRVRQAVPIMMGANIGTSVTNTIVSLMQSSDRDVFGRAFAAATVHDMFNWLTVLVLLPLEITTRYLERLTTFLMQQSGNDLRQDKSANRQFLNYLTKPFTSRIIQIDTKLVEEMAYGNHSNVLSTNHEPVHLLIRCCSDSNHDVECHQKCSLFGWLGFADTPTGLILLSFSILVLCLCLMMLVKVLNSMLTGQIAKLIKRTMNRSYAFPYSVLADYLAILIGCIMTILVQSSSIFTSALTPLAGIGVISLERIYPLTLGANIGTTTTGILAALAADTSRLHDTMQIALCHLFFNITGILLFYPVPYMRIPIPLARMLGNITATYRWFSIFYLLVMFFLLPLIVFFLSTLGPRAMLMVGAPCMIIGLLVVCINLVQHYHPHWLPTCLRDWQFLPLWMRSLDPLDWFIAKMSKQLGCNNCCATSGQLQHVTFERGNDGAKLGHHNETHHSRLHILGAMYKSNSETHLGDNFIDRRQLQEKHSVNETIKKVISKLAKASQISVNNGHIQQRTNRRNRFESWQSNNNQNWSLFNSHTVHTGSQVHRYLYSSSPFLRASTQVEYIASTHSNSQQVTSDEPSTINHETIPLTINETKVL